MRSPSGPTVEWLRALGAERLRELLAVRPDCVRAPDPRTLGELADRLARTGSVVQALNRLPLPCLQTAEALATLPGPASHEALQTLLGTDSETLAPTLRILADHALVWPDRSGALHLVTTLRDAWDAPLGLGPGLDELLSFVTSEQLRTIASTLGLKPGSRRQARVDVILEHHGDPGRLRDLIASAPEPARALLERRAAAQEPHLVTYGIPQMGSAERWLLERALLVGRDWSYEPGQVPAEVVRALRGPDWHAPFDPAPPRVELVGLTSAEVEREAAAAATSFAGQAASLLAECAARPPVALRSGGIGARELTRIGKATGCGEPVVRLVLECAYAGGLVAYEGTALAATADYDTWAAQEPADRLVLLLRAWWLLGLTPSASRDEHGKVLPAAGRQGTCSRCLAARQGALEAVAALPAGRGVADPAVIGARLHWHRPLADETPQDATPFATVIEEAELLGVLARGALTPLGAALLDEDPAALHDHARRLLPAATGTARIGADLTAVVTGAPTARLNELLDSLADRESRSAASVWRFSAASVRRALDAGLTADGIEADLREVAEGPLPQPLTYLIADTARSHGRVRLAAAACVIHSDDTALLAEIAVHRRLAVLGLRRIAPTVLLCRTEPSAALDALRAAGYAPVAETADGEVRVERRERPRAAPPSSQGPRVCVPAPRSPAAAAPSGDLAARLLAAPDRLPDPDPDRGIPFQTDTEEILAGYAKGLTLTDVRQLAHAIHESEPITIEYVAASGSRTIRTVSDIDFDPPVISAYCHLREDERTFSISGIEGVQPA
ncbi:helicase C-terminal domain-containing protein [Streptomyces sp. NBC_00390]|uniref:helicase-associated domain-containing protein n=1 Tax=Streptomyces sp. NBC_00390 TaxID=2975736 RepID=UPI002E21C928